MIHLVGHFPVALLVRHSSHRTCGTDLGSLFPLPRRYIYACPTLNFILSYVGGQQWSWPWWRQKQWQRRECCRPCSTESCTQSFPCPPSAPGSVKCIPHICPFWYTTALSTPVKVHQKVRKFATKNRPKFSRSPLSMLKSTLAWKSTLTPVVAVGTIMSYGRASYQHIQCLAWMPFRIQFNMVLTCYSLLPTLWIINWCLPSPRFTYSHRSSFLDTFMPRIIWTIQTLRLAFFPLM